MKKTSVNFTILFKRYPGQWVALGNDEKTVLAQGKTAKKALEVSKKKGHKNAILYKVPSKINFSINFSS